MRTGVERRLISASQARRRMGVSWDVDVSSCSTASVVLCAEPRGGRWGGGVLHFAMSPQEKVPRY